MVIKIDMVGMAVVPQELEYVKRRLALSVDEGIHQSIPQMAQRYQRDRHLLKVLLHRLCLPFLV